MSFKSWGFKEPLYVSKFGILEQKNSKQEIVQDIIMVTLVAFEDQLNTIGYGMQMIISECLTLGVKAGVKPEELVECIKNGSVGRGNLLNVTLPDTYLQGKFDPPNFALKLARKDVSLALELGREYDVPMEAASHAYNELTAAMNRGWENKDSRISLLLQEERAGNIEVRVDNS